MRKEIVKQLLSNYSDIRKEVRSWDGCFIDTSDSFGDYEFLPNLKDGLRKFNTENYSFTVSHSSNDGLIIEIVVDDNCYRICNLPRYEYDYGAAAACSLTVLFTIPSDLSASCRDLLDSKNNF